MTDRGSHAAMVSVVLTALAFLIVGIRTISRIFLVKRFGLDDGLILAAVCFSIGLSITIEIQRSYNLGEHIAELTLDQSEGLFKSSFACTFAYIAGLTCAKDSIAYQYLRFFQTRTSRFMAWSLIGLVTTFCVIFWICSLLSCRPLSSYWTVVQKGHCFNIYAFWFFSAGFNIVTDIALCILPIPTLMTLRMPPKQKYSLIFVFVLGGFGCVTSVLRLIKFYEMYHSVDLSYDLLGPVLWSSIEVNTGIICACLPALKPLFTLISPLLLHSSSRDSSRRSRQPSFVVATPEMKKYSNPTTAGTSESGEGEIPVGITTSQLEAALSKNVERNVAQEEV
ncbi:hypothetical protein LTR67_007074 [Exophiala xenobiotica]